MFQPVAAPDLQAHQPYIEDLVEQLTGHPLYQSIHDEVGVRTFMRSHVFCVWDFQSLLTSMQRRLSCVEAPWIPTRDAEARRLVNEIVLDEESDIHPAGGYASHFELYIDAMNSCGADTGPIMALINMLHSGASIEEALATVDVPSGVRDFVDHTFDVIKEPQKHHVVASFTYGREDIIPDMFICLVKNLANETPNQWKLFMEYLNRHIECDGERHGPISKALLARICANNPRLWEESEMTIRKSLEMRIKLWDAIHQDVMTACNR